MVDARLPDGSRVNAVIPPLAVDGPLLTIRKFAADRLPVRRPGRLRAASTPHGGRFLRAAVRGAAEHRDLRRHGHGQDDAAERLAGFIPDGERIVTSRTPPSCGSTQQHVARLETQPAEHRGARRDHGSATW